MPRIPNWLIFSLALVVVELSANLLFFTKYKLQNISGTHAATYWLKMGDNLSNWSNGELTKRQVN
jgi:hypothetical protein